MRIYTNYLIMKFIEFASIEFLLLEFAFLFFCIVVEIHQWWVICEYT